MAARGFVRIGIHVAAICLLAAGLARAADDGASPMFPKRAETGWQAHALLHVGGEEISLEVYREGGRERQETTLDGVLQVLIVRPSIGRVFVVVPSQDEIFDLPIEDAGLLPPTVGFGDVEAEFLGQGMMGDETVWHFRITGQDGLGQHFDGEVWVTPDGIPLRVTGEVMADGDRVDFTIQLSLVSRGPQPDHLFAPPVDTPRPIPQDG